MACWGSNRKGALGTGYDSDNDSAGFIDRRNFPDYVLMEDGTPADRTDNAHLTNVALTQPNGKIGLVGRVNGYCALTNGGGVHCWGYDELNHCGRADWDTFNDTPVMKNNNALNRNTANWVEGMDDGAATDVLDLSCGDNYCCTLHDNDDLKCWGDNGEAQLGLGNANSGPYERGAWPPTLATAVTP